METNQFRRQNITKIYAAFITMMLFGAAAGLMFYHHSHGNLSKSVENEKVRNEQLLSEKLLLEKDIASMRNELVAMQAYNKETGLKLQNALASVTDRENKIKSMTGENVKAKRLLGEVNDLRNLKKTLEQELAQVRNDRDNVLAENNSLKGRIAELEHKNGELLASVQSLHQVAVNNSLVEATKGNKDKLTVAAKRTRKVKVGFDLPEEMIGNLFFRMSTPVGETVTSDHSTISVMEEGFSDAEMTVSIDPVMGKTTRKKHINMVYEPKNKLESGIYKIDVYSGEQYLGTTGIHLK